MLWKVVADSLVWKQLEVHLLVVGKVWVFTLSRLCFLNFEVLKARLCPVSALSPLNAYRKEKFLNFPCTAFCKCCPSSWEPLRPGTTKTVQGTWCCCPKYEGQGLGFFRAADHKDSKTGQSNVLHHVTASVIWEKARLLKVLPRSSLVLLPPWAAAMVPWSPLLQAACRSLNWVLLGLAVKLQKRM